jgi:hypothetical protein
MPNQSTGNLLLGIIGWNEFDKDLLDNGLQYVLGIGIHIGIIETLSL